MAKHKSFGRHVKERTRKPFVRTFDFDGENYEVRVTASFAMMEVFSTLEQEVAERTQGDPDLQKPENQAWVFQKTAEALELLVGEENYKRLKTKSELEDALDLVQWLGDEMAEERQAQRDDEPDEQQQRGEVGPEDAPEGNEGKQGEGLPSRQMISWKAGGG